MSSSAAVRRAGFAAVEATAVSGAIGYCGGSAAKVGIKVVGGSVSASRAGHQTLNENDETGPDE
jgi:hypothetical protein